MKNIVTFAAAAALMAGVSVANAQSTMSKSGTMGKTSATNSQYCLDLNGAKNCKYPTLAACQKDATGGGGKCDKNPNFAKNNKNGMKSNAMEPKSGGTATTGGSTGSSSTTDSMNKSGPAEKAR